MHKKPSGVWIMAYTDIDDPSSVFQCTLYTGNASNGHAITHGGNSDLDNDLVWIKSKTTSGSHRFFDTSRGANKILTINNTSASDGNYSSTLAAFGDNGFTVNNDSDDFKVNANGVVYVSWNWKETAGAFDIVAYTGSGSAKTVAHNLGLVPQMMWIKCTSNGSTNWTVYTAARGNNKWMYLNSGNAASANANAWNNTTPTASVFTVGTDGDVNGDGRTYQAYLFGNKQGVSKAGSFVGNANANGTFVPLSFAPAYVMSKNSSSSESWHIWDNKRSPFNRRELSIYQGTTGEEDVGADIDMLSNGFKVRGSAASVNGSGHIFTYLAFAENPFVTSTGIPGTAR